MEKLGGGLMNGFRIPRNNKSSGLGLGIKGNFRFPIYSISDFRIDLVFSILPILIR